MKNKVLTEIEAADQLIMTEADSVKTGHHHFIDMLGDVSKTILTVKKSEKLYNKHGIKFQPTNIKYHIL